MAWSGEARRANLEAERASREAMLAEEALAESRELSNFLVSLFSLTGEASGAPERMTTRELLNLGANNLDSMEAVDPLAKARLRQLLGEVYTELFMLDQAEGMVRQALDTRRELLGPNHPSVADSMGQLADILRTRMSYEESEPLLLEALDIARRARPQDLAITADLWSRLGELYSDQSRLDEAITAHERALEIREFEMRGQDDRALANSLYDLGVILQTRGRSAEAEAYFSQAIEIYRSMLGNGQRIADTLANLAQSEEAIGQLDDAEKHLREAYDVWATIESPDDSNAIRALERLVQALTRWGRYNEGIIAGQRALALREGVLGRNHPDLINSLMALSINEGFAGDYRNASRNLDRALGLAVNFYGEDDRGTRAVRDALGWLAWQRGEYEEALTIHQEFVEFRLATNGQSHVLSAFSGQNTALALAALGRYEEADRLMTQALVTSETDARLRSPQHR